MPYANKSAQSGESYIESFKLKGLEVSQGTIELNYYESILDCSVRASAQIVDTGFRAEQQRIGESMVEKEDIDLRLSEPAEIVIVDGNQAKLKTSLILQRTRDLFESHNKAIYSLDFYTKEAADNEEKSRRVIKKFTGKPSDHVPQILKEYLGTSKECKVDETWNEYNVTFTTEKPFYACTYLGPKSGPSRGTGALAGYLFYENADGYNFRSIDILMSEEPKRKLIYNDLVERTPPPGYDAKILNYAYDNTLDLNEALLTSSLGIAKKDTFSHVDSYYEISNFDSNNQYQVWNTGGKRFPNPMKKETKIFTKWSDEGVNPSGSIKNQIGKSKEINFNSDEILRQSYMRYNNLYAIKLSIAIPLDLELKAGDKVLCDFPEVSSKSFKIVSQKKSGIYMIADLCHHITPKRGNYTRLNLVRETVDKK